METCDMNKHFKIPKLYDYYQNLDVSNMYCLEETSWNEDPPAIEGAFDA